MRTKLSILLTITMILTLIPISAFALEPVDQMMYANEVTFGEALPINISAYTGYHHLRLDPANALGEFDAVQTDGGMANAKFFGLAAREWTEYTFEESFCNVDWETDIQFAEVTWGTSNGWHPEAAKVYLIDAIVDGELETEPYFVGIVWNRIGINYISAADRLLVAQSYSPDPLRDLATSELDTEGVIEITGFNLPAQVESASGIRLIDITKEIYDEPTTSPVGVTTYTNGAGGRFTVNRLPLVYPNDGAVTIANINPAGNTDGFDLDAIRVWKCPPVEEYGFCGYKLDAETGEGLEGWIIILRDELGEVVKRTTTNSEGRYCFGELPRGTYEVEELEKEGWEQVFPGGGSHMVTLPEEPMIFGIERTANRPILQIDPMTGDVSHIFDTDINSFSLNGPNGLAYDSGSGTFYYVTYPYNAEFGNATLFRYVRGEASAEEIYKLDHELACADFYDGKYYYIAGGPKGATDDLYEVVFDGNGEVADVNAFLGISGALNYNWTFSGDIAISPDGVIYGVGLNGGSYQFFSVERDGSDFTLIDPSIGMPLQLAFSRDGVLFGNNLSNNSFYTVDLATGDTVLTAASKSTAAFNDMASGIQYYNFENMEEELFGFCGFKLDAETGFGLEGWTIILRDLAGKEIDRTITDENGKYCFEGLLAGTYTVEEVGQDGWEAVLPDDGKLTITLPAALNLIDNGDFEQGNGIGFTSEYIYVDPSSPKATNPYNMYMGVEGTYTIGKNPFNHHDLWTPYSDHTSGIGNMMIVNGEEFAAGKIVWTSTVAVDPGTEYNFSFWGATSYPDAYSSLEVWINGVEIDTYDAPDFLAEWTKYETTWSSGTAEVAEIELICNTLVHTGNDFALDDFVMTAHNTDFRNKEMKLFEIAGFKLDGDTEEGLEGWTINLYKWDEINEWVLFETDVTDDLGKYCFPSLEEGEYKVEEVMKDGWIQLEPEDDVHMVMLPEGASDCEEETNLYNFVNTRLFDIAGYKLDGDSEEGLEDWTIKLFKWDEALQDYIFVEDMLTDENGKYCFPDLEAGEYKVEEEMVDGWIQLEPEDEDFYLVSLPAGASDCEAELGEEDANFYKFVNAELFDLCGFKYGVNWLDLESKDNPLAGWTIKLMDGDKLIATTTTDADGHYCFKDLRAGDYTIVESFGVMNGYGFWKFDSKLWKPVESAEIEVSLPNDASDCEIIDTHHNFYNLCYKDETAWMKGDTSHIGLPGLKSNNWGWSEALGVVSGEPRILETLPIYAAAGQNDITKGYLAGTLEIYWDGAKVLVRNVEAEDWVYLEGMKVWIGNTPLPLAKKGAYTNAPGKLIIDPKIDYTKAVFVAVHFESLAPCGYTMMPN